MAEPSTVSQETQVEQEALDVKEEIYANDEQQQKKNQKDVIESSGKPGGGRVLLLAIGGIVALVAIRLIRRLRSKPKQSLKFKVEAVDENVETRSVKARTLEDVRLGASECFAKGQQNWWGVPELAAKHAGDATLPQAITQLLESGAKYIGRYLEVAFGVHRADLLLTFANAAAPRQLPGDSHVGLSQALAHEHVDLGIALDSVGEARVSASCSGLFCFKASGDTVATTNIPGAAPSSSPAPHVQHVALLARDLVPLQAAARSLLLPGATKQDDVVKIIIARDLFRIAGGSAAVQLFAAAKQLGIEWAGRDEVGLVELCEFLAPSEYLKKASAGETSPASVIQRLGELGGKLQSYALAASEQGRELLKVHAESPSDLASPVAEQVAALKTSSQANGISAAQEAAQQLSKMIKQGLSQGVILLYPTAPPLPPVDADAEAVSSHLRLARAFHVLSNLTGCPTVTMPVALGAHGLHSLTLLGPQRSDQFLLMLAAKMQKFLPKAIARALAPLPQPAAAPATATRALPEVDDAATRANDQKQQGNEAFKAGRLGDAIMHYSEAIKLDPKNAVYYSNRAMAYLKMLMFEEAEGDCDRALRLDLTAKTLLRRATARMQLGKLQEAEKDFVQVLQLEPNNRQAAQELRALRELTQEQAGGAVEFSVQ